MTKGLSNRRLKEIRSLVHKKYRERLGEMLVEGMRGVESAIDASAPVREILVTQHTREEAARLLEGTGLEIHVVSDSEMNDVSDVETSQGILAVVAIEQIEPDALPSMRRIIALDGIQDPGNAGTLIRTAAWFGVDAVITAPGTVDLYNPKVVRAAMGGLWDIAHASVEDLISMLADLCESDFALYAADLRGTEASEWVPRAPSVLVFGSEAHGISEAARALIDEGVVIPGRPRRGGAESLNVAVAGGIILYEWTQGRKNR